MPHRRQVPRLEILTLTAASFFIAKLGQKLGVIRLTNFIIFRVPRPLIEPLSKELLFALQNLIEITKKSHDPRKISLASFVKEMNSIVSLTEVALTSQLRVLDLPFWPKMMRYVMFRSLSKLTGLQTLDLGACLASWGMGSTFLRALSNMSNLHTVSLCFDCTDQIIQVLSENCQFLRRLDVTSSRSVTNRCVTSLLHCQKLQQLQLNRTSVTPSAYAQLLLDLPYLEDLGRCDQLGLALEHIQVNYSKNITFNLRKFQSRDVTLKHLKLLSEMCPNLYHISIFYDEDTTNLSVLTSFTHLTELKLLSCNFYSDCIKQLLEKIGHNLTLIHLEHIDEVDLNALTYISQFCPELESLVLYNCDLCNNESRLYFAPIRIKPFQNLQRLFCVADCANLHLEFLLSNCYEIKYIHLGSSTGITHEMLIRILGINPMKNLEELRILYGGDLNLETVEAILESCQNLRLLSELEGWNGISMEELQNFKKYIKENNYDLDIRPTLSY